MRTKRFLCRLPGGLKFETTELAPTGPGEVTVQTELAAASPGTERACVRPRVAAEPIPWRRARAAHYAATDADDLDAVLGMAALVEHRRSPNPGFDSVIDATGHPSAIASAVAVGATQAAILLQRSTCGLPHDFDVYDIHRKGLHIIGARPL